MNQQNQIKPRIRVFTLRVAVFSLLCLAVCGKHNNPIDPVVTPSVLILSPADGDTLSPVGFRLTGSAADEGGIDQVRLELNGVRIDSTVSSPFSFLVPSILFEDGAELSISVTAKNPGGVTGSKSIRVFLREMSFRSIGSTADQEREPAWSPDGGTIAYVSEGSGGNDDIWTVPAGGGEAARITDSPNEDRSPCWAPWGTTLAFASDHAGNWDIWTVDIAGDEPIRITTSGSNDRGPAWSPNGGTIAFHSFRDGNWNLFGIPMTGENASGDASELTASSTAESSATWRSDGAVIAFTSNQTGNMDIWSVTPPSMTLIQIQGANDSSSREIDPAYAPGRGHLLYSWYKNGNYDLRVLDPATGTARVVTSHFGSDLQPAWSPDGDKIAFTSNRNGTYDIWIIE